MTTFVVKNAARIEQLYIMKLPRTLDISGTTARELSLAGASVTDDQLPSIVSPMVESLNLSGTSISGASVEFLARLKNLKWLDVSLTKLTAADIQLLKMKTAGQTKTLQGVGLSPP